MNEVSKKKPRMSHAHDSNEIFGKVCDEYEAVLGDIGNHEVQELINHHFRWEQISYVTPLQPLNVKSPSEEWRLMY